MTANVIVTSPPLAGTDAFAGAAEKTHGMEDVSGGVAGGGDDVPPFAACCEMVTDFPAIVSVATRAAPAFAAMLMCTVPDPVRPSPSEIFAKSAFDAAVQAQELPEVVAATVIAAASGPTV